MLTEVKNELRLLKITVKYNIIKRMDNRGAFISSVIGMILNNSIIFVQWFVLFNIKDSIGGYGYREVGLLWAFAAGCYGLTSIFLHNTRNISELIFSGKLDSYIVQPRNTLLNLASSDTREDGFGDLFFGILILLILRVSLINFILALFLMLMGAITITSLNIITHSLSFKYNNMEDFANQFNGGVLAFMTYPINIFGGDVRWLFYTIIPVGFIVAIPISLITTFSVLSLLMVIAFTTVIAGLATFMFYRGIKKYSSSNLMVTRI